MLTTLQNVQSLGLILKVIGWLTHYVNSCLLVSCTVICEAVLHSMCAGN